LADSDCTCPGLNTPYHRDDRKINPLVFNIRYTCCAAWAQNAEHQV
jgi:hypothetical protein